MCCTNLYINVLLVYFSSCVDSGSQVVIFLGSSNKVSFCSKLHFCCWLWFLFMLQSQNLPLDNVSAMLRMLITLDSKERIISEQAFVSLVKFLPRYLIDIVSVSIFFCLMYILPSFPPPQKRSNKTCLFLLCS